MPFRFALTRSCRMCRDVNRTLASEEQICYNPVEASGSLPRRADREECGI